MTLWRKSEDMVGGFLDNGTEVTGELQFTNTLRIDGAFHGSILSKDRLIVGEGAVVHADIKVGDIEIRGQVYGNVAVERQAEILSTGVLRGDVHSAVLIIQAGATFEGHSHKVGAVLQETPESQTDPERSGKGAESLIQ
jgi:cytoskeletal protein CcmA (bactofilin family)